MLQVSEVIHLTLFKDFKLIAGESGLANELNNIVILEYESINHHYDVFKEGDFILTSLFYAKDHEELIYESFQELIKRKVSGIAVKTVFYKDIPDNAKELANQHNLPIFLFEDAYMEDLILSANELLKTKLSHLVFEEKIKNIIQTRKSPYEIESTMKEINPSFHPKAITAYITAKSPSGRNTIQNYFTRLIYKKYKTSAHYSYSYVKYGSGMILIYSFSDQFILPSDGFADTVSKLLHSIELEPEYYHIGICDLPMEQNRLDLSIQQAIYANYTAILKQQDILSYSQMGIYQYLAPLTSDPTIMKQYSSSIQKLKDYDKRHISNLLDTLRIYIHHNGDIAKTAAKIYQHPNTVRYRLKKTAHLLNCDPENQYEQLYLLIHLYELHEVM
ncbi:regulator of polyketide synthase expression [Lachnospiraceae bacterium KM106-2]|nr:regulator of polyketide synthase expression [Lachnospiraceae bacterium KM106-2]